MKLKYILIVLVIAALTLGCIGNKQSEPSTSAPVAPVDTSVSPATSSAIDDPFGTDLDVANLDAMLADSSMDISLTESI